MDNRTTKPVMKPVMLGLACTGLAVLGSVFSGCVPTTPAAETTLNFLIPGSRSQLQNWTPSNGTLKTLAKTSIGLDLASAQPKGTALLYVTGIIVNYTGVGAYLTLDSAAAAPLSSRISIFNAPSHEAVSDQPTWSPDGNYLSLVETTGTDASQGVLYITSPTGVRTTVGPAKPNGNPEREWSADSRKVLYSSPYFFGYERQLHVYDVISKQDRVLADSTEDFFVADLPRWLSDNRHLLVQSIDVVRNEIVHRIIDSEATAPNNYQEVLRTPGGSQNLSVQVDASPTADRFLVTTTPNDSQKTFTLKFADGRNPVTLTNAVEAKWSSSGNHIALVKDSDPALYEVAIADRDGQIIDTVSKSAASASYRGIYWSPSGKNLVISYIDEGDMAHVLLKTLPSGNWREIYFGRDRPIYTPSWSPDEKIAIVRGNQDTYLFDARHPDQPATAMDAPYAEGPWTSDSKKAALCRPLGDVCEPTVLNVTANGYTLTPIPVQAAGQMLWSEPAL